MFGLIWMIGCLATDPNDFVMHMEQYEHNSVWPEPPIVVLCTEQSQFTREDVEYVLSLWEQAYQKIVVRRQCEYDLEPGIIKIVDGKFLDHDAWGYTAYYYSDVIRDGHTAQEYTSALVQIDTKIQHRTILVHEMGHAFGYHHVDIDNDVMQATADYSAYYEDWSFLRRYLWSGQLW